MSPFEVDALAEDPPTALGSVVEQDRGSLPFALIHGEALVAAAAWALGEAGVTPVDHGVPWSGVVASGEPYVLHDSLCPMTPPAFIATCLARAVESGHVVVGVRPTTDTVKRVRTTTDGEAYVGATLDRDALVTVCSPVVLPPAAVAALDGLPTYDLAALVAGLPSRFEVDLVEAPTDARRVADLEGLAVLEALTRDGGQPGDQLGGQR